MQYFGVQVDAVEKYIMENIVRFIALKLLGRSTCDVGKDCQRPADYCLTFLFQFCIFLPMLLYGFSCNRLGGIWLWFK